MSSPPVEPCSGFGTPNFSPQANSEGTGDRSRMPGYTVFKHATNNFSDQQKLGTGRLGDVYKAKLSTGEVVAVKVLYQMSGPDDETLSHTCTQLMTLNHENLVRLLGYSYEKGVELLQYNGESIMVRTIHRLISFEYVPGGSLAGLLSDQNLGLRWDMRFKIIKGICEGLQYLHDVAGIMHFNLTPDNILLDSEKVPKIKDFGLSWIFDIWSSCTTEGSSVDKMYAPPEYLARGEMTRAYDIFCLGIIIKRIVTGSMDYSSIADMDGREYVEHVYKNWKQRLQEIEGYPSFVEDCQQLRTCIEIAVACTQRDPHERPVIKDIVLKLYEVETVEDYTSSRIEQGIRGYEVRRMTFMELQHVTSNFSDKLGPDGFGAVCKGKLKNGEVIAVKRLDKSLRKIERDFQRMVFLMRLEHKNIVRLTGYCYEPTKVPVPDDNDPKLYVVKDVIENLLCCEFLPNGSLDMILNDKSCEFDWQTRHRIIHGICDGLHHLHVECQDAPIVHEGLKPNNILLDDGMIPKLGDFCTSMAVTPRGYIAPEVMETGKVTIKSNIYSLGILIIEIATGDRCPNNESSGRSYIENVLKSRVQDSYAASMYPRLDQGFVQQLDSWISIGLKCVEIQPEKRPTIGQIIHFLETESANSEFYHHGEFILSSESSITSWSSSEMNDHASELGALVSMLDDISLEPRKISYTLIKSITKDFSQVVGRGGFGVVYLGFIPNGEVAVKKLSISQEFSDDLFLDEIKCLKRANHKNVARFLGYCADSHGELLEFNGRNVIAEVRQRMLCFEFVPKGNLHRHIKEKSRETEWRIHYQMIIGICHGLQYLHKQRINHLDLKLENILLDAHMEPKITDFGLSRCFDEGQSRMFTKNIRGTPGWMAPEIINNGEMSFKSDIYGLGIIIIKLLTRNINYDFENWHKSVDMNCPQVKCCAEIAQKCIDDDQHKRPTIDEIVSKLNEIENTIQEESPVIE